MAKVATGRKLGRVLSVLTKAAPDNSEPPPMIPKALTELKIMVLQKQEYQ